MAKSKIEKGQTEHFILRLFNDKYPHTGFTDAKKIDFIMWVDG